MIKIPKNINKVLTDLHKAGFEAYIVGGCVRDSLMGKTPMDYDITTSALPWQMKEVFEDHKIVETGITHGTSTLIIEGNPIEITTYRIEDGYSDNRHPDKVEFTSNIKEDMARRDFTMNAIAFNYEDGIVDYFGGQEDIKARIIRCVGRPDARFKEDALRIMRALRFAAVTGFEIESDTLLEANNNRELLKNISAERVRDELCKLLCAKNTKKVLTNGAEIIGTIIPEIVEAIGFNQKNPHHVYDVYEHTLGVVDAIEPKLELRLAAFLHDIGKPRCFSQDEEGIGHFYKHELVSAQITQDIMERLKFDNATKASVVELVKNHGVEIATTEKSVKRALNKLSPETFLDLLKLKRADNLGQGQQYWCRQEKYNQLEEMAKSIIERKECFSLKDMELDGDDLLAMGMNPGKEIGEILENLLEAVINEDVPNEKEVLKAKAASIIEKIK